MNASNTIKRITVDLTPPKKAREDDDNDIGMDEGPGQSIDRHHCTVQSVQAAVPKKRSVIALDSWQFSATDLQPDMQRSYIKQLNSKIVIAKQPCKVIQQHIMQKLNGYKAQDVKKEFHDPEKFADVEYVIQMLEESSNSCYYCKESVQVLYENVREPKQWSLDRIYNNQGHNKGNLVIACLKCNLSRKTMYHERYAFTKQLVIVKQN